MTPTPEGEEPPSWGLGIEVAMSSRVKLASRNGLMTDKYSCTINGIISRYKGVVEMGPKDSLLLTLSFRTHAEMKVIIICGCATHFLSPTTTTKPTAMLDPLAMYGTPHTPRKNSFSSARPNGPAAFDTMISTSRPPARRSPSPCSAVHAFTLIDSASCTVIVGPMTLFGLHGACLQPARKTNLTLNLARYFGPGYTGPGND